MHRLNWLLGIGFTCLAASARAESFSIDNVEANFDRWMYSFNSSPGTRQSAPVFGAVGEGSFDDRDGQFLIGFNTAAAGAPTVLPAGKKYRIEAVSVTATHSMGAFTYDATFDDYRSYLDPSDLDHLADADAGRPLELFGMGFRSGYVRAGFGPTVPGPITFEEGDIFAFGDPTAVGIRNAYAADAVGADVSNVIKDRLWGQTPWAVGTTNLTPGSAVTQGVAGASAGSTFAFDVNLRLAGVEDYLIQGLQQGALCFSITSLHQTSQAGGGNPNLYTRDNFDPAAIAPTLSLRYSIVPEPSSWALAVIGGAGLIALGRRRVRRSA